MKKIYKTDWFVEAPLILGICSIPEKMLVKKRWKSYSDVDAAIVMDHIILTATDLGLGTCWIGAFDSQGCKRYIRARSFLGTYSIYTYRICQGKQLLKRQESL